MRCLLVNSIFLLALVIGISGCAAGENPIYTYKIVTPDAANQEPAIIKGSHEKHVSHVLPDASCPTEGEILFLILFSKSCSTNATRVYEHNFIDIIAVDDKKIGDNQMMTHYETEISPGQHSLLAFTYKTESGRNICSVAELDFTLKAGTYYIVKSRDDIDIEILDTSIVNINYGFEEQNIFPFNPAYGIECSDVEPYRDAFFARYKEKQNNKSQELYSK